MRIGELLDASIHLYRQRWKTFMGIAAFVLVPYSFLEQYLIERSTRRTSLEGFTFRETSEATIIVTVLFTLVLFLVITPFLSAAFARASSDVYMGHSPTIAEVYRFALSRTHSILWVSFLTMLAVGGGFLLLLIPGILFLVRFTFGSVVVAVEDVRGTKAMGRSWRLATGHFWKILGTIVLAGILTSILGGILQIPFTLLGTLMDSGGWVLTAIGGSLSGVVTRPFAALVGVLLYFDMRIRKEGLDLALMARELQQHTP